MKLLTCLSEITLSTSLKSSFSFFIALTKLIPCDFQIKQKWLVYLNNDVSLCVMFRGFLLVPSKQPMLIIYITEWLNSCGCHYVISSLFTSNKT